MKIKKGILILILLISIFHISNVSAMTCADIQKEIEKYNSINTELAKYDCTNVEDQTTVSKCNQLNLEKNSSLSTLYKISEDEKGCSNNVEQAKKIIEENKENCGVVLGDFVDNILNYFLAIFYIAGPALLILFGTLDFTKATFSNDKDALKKASNKFLKRILALVFLFLSPALTKIIISINTSGYYLSGDTYACNYRTIQFNSKSRVTYVARPEEDTKKTSKKKKRGKQVAGEYASWKQYEGPWSTKDIKCGTMKKCGCLITSVAIQIANSGTATSSSFDPGDLVDSLNKNNGFSGTLFNWQGWDDVAPSFKLKDAHLRLTGSLHQKATTLKSYLDQGYYPVVEVKEGSGGSHYVAILSVEGDTITMADPGSTNTVLDGSTYPFFVTNGHQLAVFYVDN